MCQPPDSSLDWRFVGEVVQNTRVIRSEDRTASGWRTVTSVSNPGSAPTNATLSASYDTNVTASAAIVRWGIGSSHRDTWTHAFEVSVPARSRVRLMHQRREHYQELRWDVMCAWRHAKTGQARLTTYGRGYRGGMWRLYDAYDVRTERL
ncbi:MAG: hypothetical protein EA416_05975 [Trueperaceae bacterium]|nr:MAG: hypothetical protein EA416_05975 [Trueperaceae bacterium]